MRTYVCSINRVLQDTQAHVVLEALHTEGSETPLHTKGSETPDFNVTIESLMEMQSLMVLYHQTTLQLPLKLLHSFKLMMMHRD